MKKLLALLMVALMGVSLYGCNSASAGGSGSQNLEGTLEEILDGIYQNVETDDEEFKNWLGMLETKEITADNVSYYLGTDIEFEEAIASEPMITSQAYSLCLVRVKDGADIEKIKSDIKENVDPRKWICVGVEEKDITVDNIGNVVILIMSTNQQVLHDAFQSLAA